MRLLFVLLTIFSLSLTTKGQSLFQLLKMARYANQLSQLPGVGKYMGHVFINSGELISIVLDSEEHSSFFVRLSSRLAKLYGKTFMKTIFLFDDLFNAAQRTTESIIGFIMELPATSYNIGRTNFYILHDPMDNHDLTLNGLIEDLGYMFFGTQSSYSPKYKPALIPQMGQGMSTQPIIQESLVEEQKMQK